MRWSGGVSDNSLKSWGSWCDGVGVSVQGGVKEIRTEAIPLVHNGHLDGRPRRVGVVLVGRVVEARVGVVPQVEQVDRGGQAGVGAADHQDPGDGGVGGVRGGHCDVLGWGRVSAPQRGGSCCQTGALGGFVEGTRGEVWR